MKVSHGEYLMAKKEFINYKNTIILEEGKKYIVHMIWVIPGYNSIYRINGWNLCSEDIIKYFYTKQEERELKLKKLEYL